MATNCAALPIVDVDDVDVQTTVRRVRETGRQGPTPAYRHPHHRWSTARSTPTRVRIEIIHDLKRTTFDGTKDVIVCGHTHRPINVVDPVSHTLIINPGSVSRPRVAGGPERSTSGYFGA